MVVIVFTVGAAVKPAANSLPEDTKEPEPTQPTMEAVQQEPYPFNLMSLDWSGEELEGWTRYEVPEDYADNGGYLPECMQQYTYIICKQYGVEYTLVLAIIEIESGYRWDKCKFCGAEVKLGERCQYCGSVAEAFYYKPEEPPEVVGKNLTDQKEYTVQKGDSLWRIAQRFYGNGAACYALAHRNGIKNPDLIYPGQVLKI